MSSFHERLRLARVQFAEHDADPLREQVEAAMRGKEAISTAALLDLIGLRPTTANARRVARTLRAMNFIPIKSRRLMPGGWRDTIGRGWARAVRR